jgi:hypothetical protein
MSGINKEICGKCGKEIGRSEQAYVFNETIVCSQCNQKLRKTIEDSLAKEVVEEQEQLENVTTQLPQEENGSKESGYKVFALFVAILLVFDGIVGFIKFELYEKQHTVTAIRVPGHPGIPGVVEPAKPFESVIELPVESKRRLGAIPPIAFALIILIRVMRPGLTGWRLTCALIGGFLISAALVLPFAPPYQGPRSFVSLEGNVLQLTRVIAFLLDMTVLRVGGIARRSLLFLSPWLAMSILFVAMGIVGTIFMKESFRIKGCDRNDR